MTLLAIRRDAFAGNVYRAHLGQLPRDPHACVGVICPLHYWENDDCRTSPYAYFGRTVKRSFAKKRPVKKKFTVRFNLAHGKQPCIFVRTNIFSPPDVNPVRLFVAFAVR
jgi:hypothetical protein